MFLRMDELNQIHFGIIVNRSWLKQKVPLWSITLLLDHGHSKRIFVSKKKVCYTVLAKYNQVGVSFCHLYRGLSA